MSTASKDLHLSPAFENVPDVLLPYQQAWLADRSQVKVCEKSRRIGLSWAEAADAALTAARQNGMDVYYMAYNQDMTQQFVKDVAFWAKHYNLAAGEVEEVVLRDEDRDVLVYQVNFASGHVVQALSSAPRNLRSKKGRAIFDEFAFVDQPAELLKAGLAFLIWGGDLRVISTHNGVENPFNSLVQEIREGKKPYSLHKITFDDALEDGLYRRICLMTGEGWTAEAEAAWREEIVAFYGDGASEELFCVPAKSGGRYLPRVLIEACTDDAIPVVRLSLPAEWALKSEPDRVDEIAGWCLANLRPILARADENLRSFYGLDFGRTGDLTVLLPAQEEKNLVRRALAAIELRGVPFEAQRQILFYVADRLPRFVAGAHDATGNGAYLAEVAAQRYGTRIQQVKLNASWYLDAFPRYKAAFEDRKVVLPADADVVADHGEVVVQNGVPLVPATGTRKGADGGQRHGDAAIAGVLMWSASLSAAGPIDFQSASPTAATAGADRFATGGRTAPLSLDVTDGFATLPSSLDTSGFTR